MPQVHHLALSDTPLGALTLVADGSGLRRLRFGHPVEEDGEPLGPAQPHPILRPAAQLLARALEGDTVDWSPIPLELDGGTDFQRAVWEALRAIPHGSVTSYGALTRTVGRGSPRAVGQAVGANPIPVIIPCHRVVSEGGRLGGFSGGLGRKVRLLSLEGIETDGPRPEARIHATIRA